MTGLWTGVLLSSRILTLRAWELRAILVLNWTLLLRLRIVSRLLWTGALPMAFWFVSIQSSVPKLGCYGRPIRVFPDIEMRVTDTGAAADLGLETLLMLLVTIWTRVFVLEAAVRLIRSVCRLRQCGAVSPRACGRPIYNRILRNSFFDVMRLLGGCLTRSRFELVATYRALLPATSLLLLRELVRLKALLTTQAMALNLWRGR